MPQGLSRVSLGLTMWIVFRIKRELVSLQTPYEQRVALLPLWLGVRWGDALHRSYSPKERGFSMHSEL